MELGRGTLARAVRTALRSPAYSGVVVITLALGVGANTAVFTVLDSVLLEPLPYPEPERLVRIYDVWHEEPGELQDYLRGPAVKAYRLWHEAFEGVATLYTYRETGVDLTDGDRPVRLVASHVSAGYFETLGVPPLLGRTFREEESLGPGLQDPSRVGAPVAILSHALWRGRYGGDAQVVGRTIRLDGESYQVVGIMPEGFTNPLGAPVDLWLPADLRDRADLRDDWGNHYLTGIARLAPGLTLQAAQERVDALNERLSDGEPENRGWQVALRPLHATVVGPQRRALLLVLIGAVGLVLLSACVNVANLVFARGLARDREVALRSALGAGRGRIVAHLLTETGVLAFAGGLAGLALGMVGVRALLALAPGALPSVADPALSLRVFGFALATTGAALVVFGMVPALRLSGTSPADTLRAGGRGGTETRSLRRLRDGLVVAQVAVAVTLVGGAGLLLRSFQELRSTDLGVAAEGVLTFEVHLPVTRYPDGAARDAFHRSFHERLRTLPQVDAVGAVSWLPVNGRYHSWSMAARSERDGSQPADRTASGIEWYDTDARVVAGDYFAVLGVEILQGVAPDQVGADGPPVAWINRQAAATVFPGIDPLDQIVHIGGEARRVVGVVEDIPYDAQGSVSRQTYLLHSQVADSRNWPLVQTVRARGDLGLLQAGILRELAAQDPDLVLHRPRTLTHFLSGARAQERFAALLMSVFAALALTLSAVGTYGIMAESVMRRRREIGIRLALGAAPGGVRSLVLVAALRLTGIGVALGIAGIWAGGPWLQAFLFRVEPRDPAAFAAGALSLLLLGAASGWIPALQATRVQPSETLSGE